MLKKTTFAVLGLALGSSAVFAGAMGPVCTPGSVTVPCAATNWDFGIQALYLQPTYSRGLVYGLANNNYKEVNADWSWGIRVEGSYHYNTGSDITVNWSHIDHERDIGTYDGAYFQLTPVGPTFVNGAYTLSLGNRFDQINIELGQSTNMGVLNKARFYGGLQYARIQTYPTARFATLPVFSPITGGGAITAIDTEFSGVGPVFGLDYSYTLPHGLSLTANTSASLLYGPSRINASTSYRNTLVAASVYGSRRQMVPGLEAKLGANYAYEIAQGVLNLEGGYQATNYFNVMQTAIGGNSDFALYGPYFGVKWLGNA